MLHLMRKGKERSPENWVSRHSQEKSSRRRKYSAAAVEQSMTQHWGQGIIFKTDYLLEEKRNELWGKLGAILTWACALGIPLPHTRCIMGVIRERVHFEGSVGFFLLYSIGDSNAQQELKMTGLRMLQQKVPQISEWWY